MHPLFTFLVAFFFSFIGTIPPGTLNLTMIQMGLEHRIQSAWRFAVAGSIIEYLYAWIAVEFEELITSSPTVTKNFELITGVVLLTLGIINLISSQRPQRTVSTNTRSGFRKGIILGVLNPLALPFWVAMTAYLKAQNWVSLESAIELHSYLLGVALGGLALLMSFFYLARKVVTYFQNDQRVKKIPAIVLIILGVYAIINYSV